MFFGNKCRGICDKMAIRHEDTIDNRSKNRVGKLRKQVVVGVNKKCATCEVCFGLEFVKCPCCKRKLNIKPRARSITEYPLCRI